MPPSNSNIRPNDNRPSRQDNRPPAYSADPPARQANKNPPARQDNKNPPARQNNKNPPARQDNKNPPARQDARQDNKNPPTRQDNKNPPSDRPSNNSQSVRQYNLNSPNINLSNTPPTLLTDTERSTTIPYTHPSLQNKNNSQQSLLKNKPKTRPPVIKNSNVIKPITISLILGSFFIILNIFILIIFTNHSTVSNIIVSFIGVFIVMFLFLICIIYIIVLNGKKIKMALQKIAIIMSITFGATLLLLLFSNSGKYPFINVFENSIGFFICSFIYGNSLNKLFKFKNDLFNDGEQFQPNKTVLLTLFSLENFDNLYDNFINTNNKYNFIIDNSDISI